MTHEHILRLQQLSSTGMPSSFTASLLNITPRHLRRLRQGRGRLVPRIVWNRLDEKICEYVISLKKENLSLNCQWISELASDRFERSVSRSSVWRVLHKAGLLDQEPKEQIVRKKFEAKSSGDLAQLDTTWGYWLGPREERICLILLLDDYSRFILAAEFFWEDSAYNNMWMIRDVLDDYGSFRLLYTDNASFFKAIRHNQSYYQNHRQQEYESQITRACREVGITHITHKPYQPQGKGKIERLFRFLQERLLGKLQKCADLEEANLALWEWVDWYNASHVNRITGSTPKKRFNPKGFIPLSGEVNLDDVFCFKDSRKVDKCNQFSFKGKTYAIPKEHCLVAFRVNLNIHPYRKIRVWHHEKFICELPYQN